MEEKSKGGKISTLFRDYNSICILLLLVILTSFFVSGMTKNFDTVLVEASQYGLIAMGLALVMITGNIDLSVGFQAACAAIVSVLTINATGSLPLAILAVVVTGLITGTINAFTVVKLGISPLIATIATNYIFKGFVYYFTKNGAIYPEGDLRSAFQSAIAKNYLFDSKFFCVTVIVLLLLLIIAAFVMKKTRFGVSLYISGDNAEAGKLAGIRIEWVNFAAYVLCGVCCALAGLFMASKAGAAIYTQAEGRDVFAISACVIGGVKMAGGKGTMLNVLIGILIMRVISTMMNQMLIPTAWVDFVSGALLIVILIIDKITAAKKDD